MTKKLLVAYSASSTFVQTTLDYLNAIRRFTDYEVNYVHVTHDAIMGFDFDSFDVIFHNYCARLCYEGYVSENYRAAMRSFKGLKILAVQDEYDETDRLRRAILDLGFHIVLTCVRQDSLNYVYPHRDFSHVKFISVFTGYAPENISFLKFKDKPLIERPILLGYRGRDIGGRYGRLGFDKYEIGRRMGEICTESGVSHDIAMDEESRIYGLAWFDFVGGCRAMLGTESGSNVFDFDGSIMGHYQKLTKTLGHRPSYQEFSIAEPLIAVRDREIDMGQISPRIFECAVMKTAMVLFEGTYSDAIQPHVHYIPLKKDFSNAHEVLSMLQDVSALEAMTARAYDHLIQSNEFGYQAFWRRISETIAELATRRIGSLRASAISPRASPSAVDPYLVEKPTLGPLGSTHFEVLTARRNLDIYKAEVLRLDLAYRAAIDSSLLSARQLFNWAQRRKSPGSKATTLNASMEGVESLESAAKRISDSHSDYLSEAAVMAASLEETPVDDQLQRLITLVDLHQSRAAAYTADYRKFHAIFESICGSMQSSGNFHRRWAAAFIERVKPHVRTVPWLIGPIRWIRGRPIR